MALVLGANGAAAQTQTVAAGLEITQLVAGKTVVLNTPAGGLPITYAMNGTMVGRAKDLEFYTGSAFDRGVWWVAGNSLCHRWRTWLGGKNHCVTLHQDNGVVHWKSSDGYAGTATIASRR